MLYLTFLNSTEPIHPKKEPVIKISVITPPPPKVKPKPVVIPPTPIIVPPKPKPKKIIKKPKPKPKHKPKKKKRVKKHKPKPKKIKHKKRVKKAIKPKPKPKPKPKKVVEPQPIINEEIYEEVYSEPVVEQTYRKQRVETPPPVQYTPPPPAPPTPKVNLEAEKRRFLTKIRGDIYANKEYPRKAKRRRIQGTVHVIFDIQRDGQAINIHTSGASKILQKAVKESIRRSFPTDIPDSIRGKFPMRGISVNVDFVLE